MKFGDVYGGWARSTEHRGERTYWNGEGGASSATAHRSLLQRNKHQRNPCTPEAKAVALFLSYIFLSARSDVRNAPVQSSAVQWQLLILHVQPGVLCWCSLCMAVHGCATMQRRNNATTYNGSRQRRGKPCQCLQLRQSSCSSRKPYASIASALNSLGSDRRRCAHTYLQEELRSESRNAKAKAICIYEPPRRGAAPKTWHYHRAPCRVTLSILPLTLRKEPVMTVAIRLCALCRLPLRRGERSRTILLCHDLSSKVAHCHAVFASDTP